MITIWEIFLRVSVGFLILLILVRIIGNKQLGQLNVFTYISGIVIGSMVSDIILHKDIPFLISMAGVALWVALAIFVELSSLKSVRVRELLDGQPIILIKNGIILRDSLKRERLNIDDLTMMLRTNNIFSILDVDYAILEPNGDLSVLKKHEKSNVTKLDLGITHYSQKFMPTTIINDGKVITKNLRESNLTEKWLNTKLSAMNIHNTADILYAEIQSDGTLYAQTKNQTS